LLEANDQATSDDEVVCDANSESAAGALVRGGVSGEHHDVPAVDDVGVVVSLPVVLLIGERSEEDDGSELARAARAHVLAALLLLVQVQSDGPRAVPASTHEAVARFRDELEENFSRWHHVTEYARQLGYSTRTLNAHVRSSTGPSAKDVIDERIALEAKRLLVHTDAPIGAVAEDLGFDDASNFTNYFRRTVGKTPTAFRAERRSTSPD
jgi:AraC-like DNA-binding protein